MIKHLLAAALITAALWAGSTAVLLLIGLGHVRTVRALIAVRRGLPRLPAGAVFHSRAGEVVMTWYNGARDTDESLLLVRFSPPTLLRWRSGRGKSKAALARRVNAELAWRAALVPLVTLPVFATTIWLALTDSWLWIYATLYLVAHYALRAVSNRIFFFKFGFLSGVTAYLFLDRAHLWHPSPTVAASLFFAMSVSAMALVAVAERTEAKAADR
ncbi:hypothetical protein [Streptomyces liangshanensis]|uniref:hypothetical protein n=1 Tax=Streptomyces liangshanensis TaxID=2717324 RepID=UPI0036DAF2FC